MQTINLDIAEAWANPQSERDVKGSSETIDSLVAHQNGAQAPLLNYLQDPTKDYDVEVYWPDFCGQSAIDCESDPCQDLTADQAEVQKKPYKITQCIEDKFSINEADFFKSFINKDSFIQKNINQKINNLLFLLDIKALTFLHANAGLNKGGAFHANASGQYEVPGALFNSTNILAQFYYDAQVSQVLSPFIVDGSNLWGVWFQANMNAQNSNGSGDFRRSTLFGDITFDPIGFAAVPEVTNSSFIISPSAYAFATKNYIPNEVPQYDEAAKKWKYSIDLGRYGARVDVFMQRICVDATKNLYKLVWLFKLHFDFLASPVGCDVNGKSVTGIIEYTKNGYGGGVIGIQQV